MVQKIVDHYLYRCRRTSADLSGQTYINLPGGVPHALKCGEEP
jgi:hypothetical protein